MLKYAKLGLSLAHGKPLGIGGKEAMQIERDSSLEHQQIVEDALSPPPPDLGIENFSFFRPW